MKFLSCSRCLNVDSNNQHSSKSHRKGHKRQQVQEITNPLVVTKRPKPKVLTPPPSPPYDRKRQFPGLLDSLTSWSRPRKSSICQKNIRRTIKVIDPPPRRKIRRPVTRTQRLIKLYEDRATSPEGRFRTCNKEFLIDPPASFSGDDSVESHQNFKNKLNTLDFKRMNTVALEDPSLYKKNSYVEDDRKILPISKFARKTMLEDFLKERVRIEQTMIDLLNSRKIRNDDKKVRFDIEPKDLCVDVTKNQKVDYVEDGNVRKETQIKLSVDPDCKVEDFYIERKTTFLKDKTVEDKSLVLKIAAKDDLDRQEDEISGRVRRNREMVFREFGKMSL